MKTHLTIQGKQSNTEVVADTGAEVNAAGPQHLKHFGLEIEDLIPPDLNLTHAGGSALNILGSYPLYITHNNQTILEDVYFAEGVSNIYLSLVSCKGICIVHQNFPDVNLSESKEINTNTVQPRTDQSTSSKQSSVPTNLPSRPSEIPFLATEQNIPKLEKWLLTTFSKTTFNNKDPMPHMGKPMKIHLKKNATPHATHTNPNSSSLKRED